MGPAPGLRAAARAPGRHHQRTSSRARGPDRASAAGSSPTLSTSRRSRLDPARRGDPARPTGSGSVRRLTAPRHPTRPPAGRRARRNPDRGRGASTEARHRGSRAAGQAADGSRGRAQARSEPAHGGQPDANRARTDHARTGRSRASEPHTDRAHKGRARNGPPRARRDDQRRDDQACTGLAWTTAPHQGRVRSGGRSPRRRQAVRLRTRPRRTCAAEPARSPEVALTARSAADPRQDQLA
jgi:hypothetical protein